MVKTFYITTLLIGSISLIQCNPIIERRQFDKIFNDSVSSVSESIPKPPKVPKVPDFGGMMDGIFSSATDAAKGAADAGNANNSEDANNGGSTNNDGSANNGTTNGGGA